MTFTLLNKHRASPPAMFKEPVPKNRVQSIITGQLRRDSYFSPSKVRSTTRRNVANSYAVRHAAPAEQKQSMQRLKKPRNQLRESRKKKTQRA